MGAGLLVALLIEAGNSARAVYRAIHFLPFMATLAAMLKRRGFDVRGSDQSVYPPMSDFLASEGISVESGYDAGHVTSDIDFVVVGNAISRGNAELEHVLDQRIPFCSR